MKARVIRCILFSVVMLSCMVGVGCSNTKDNSSQSEPTEAVQNENGAVIAISILEHGGEDGRINDWKVYQEDNKYMVSYLDRRVHFNDEEKPEIFEITEQEYSEIMSLDYAKFIREYDPSYWEGVADAVYFQTVITYENGAEESTEANMIDATMILHKLLWNYNNG